MLQENKKKILIIGIICILIIIGGLLYYFIENSNEDKYLDFEENLENEIENNIKNEIIEEEKIIVHISGQILNPGVISLVKGARLIDAINAVGGTTTEADLSKVNLAYVLEDAQKIYIPSVKDKEEKEYISVTSGDNGIITSKSSQISNNKEEKLMININTANEEELQKLPGIGESIATKIINYRKENGKFKVIEDIKNVSGIGDSKFNKIKDNISIK